MKKTKVCKMIKKASVEDEFETYAKIVMSPKFICSNCGRAAKKEKFLCKPMALPKKNKKKNSESEKSNDSF